MAKPTAQELRIAALLGREPRSHTELQFEATGLVLDGHFRLHGNQHSRKYIRIPVEFYETRRGLDTIALFVAQLIASKQIDMSEVEWIAGPQTGGAILGYELAVLTSEVLNRNIPFCAIKKDKESEFGYVLPDAFARAIAGKKVLAVDDVMSSGITLATIVIPMLKQSGALVTGAAVIADRSNGHGLYRGPLESYWSQLGTDCFEASDCPMCQAGEPIMEF